MKTVSYTQSKIGIIIMILLCNLAQAQPYPGGVSTDMAVWLDAGSNWSSSTWDNLAPAATSAFSSIPRRGSTPYPYQYATPSHFNFNPAIQFTGSSDYTTNFIYPVTSYYSTNSSDGQITFFAASNSTDFDMISTVFSFTIAPLVYFSSSGFFVTFSHNI